MKSLLEEYMNRIRIMEGKEYLLGVVLYSIAPTLAGHKPSSIITLSRSNGNLYYLWEEYERSFLLDQNMDFYKVKERKEAITLLFYDKKKLEEVIYEERNMKFLDRFGYRVDFSLEENLQVLKLRFREGFPHEIGIFLGIPLEEVICFIEAPDKECLLSGYWKVYNNLEYAKESFSRYDTDKDIAIKCVLRGVQPSLVIRS